MPFGNYKNPNIINAVTLRAVHKFLNETDHVFLNTDFANVIRDIEAGSFVYFDPPYDPVSDSSSFTGYTMDGFNAREQERLKGVCDQLHQKGGKFLLSNSATEFIKDLYKDYNIHIVQANRNINSIAAKRGKIEEVLIRNYD